jgi:hypothetical protein
MDKLRKKPSSEVPSEGTTIEDEFAALAPEEQPVGVMFSTAKPEPAL